ncbi:DUF4390 domain-containing protein [uncultured Thiocystis sp.]|jgi:hypothetical protein|uniref:DUF4390 domain-containing protein n=1 Tax=uncultured Thiocystis sp. TaxID=1202134 RepID=UPI0025F9B12C|nr:DUF4390 domain-containing protein [uncultured Thiocystis sp.]
MSGGHATRIRQALTLSLAFALLTWIILSSALAGDDFAFRQSRIRLEDGVYYLDATIDSSFSEEALEALNNGVPLTIVIHLQIRRVNAWLWEDSLLDRQMRYAIRYKPLSERYEVYRLPGTSGRGFETREAAIRALGELQNVQLIAQDKLDQEEDYELQIKVFLDIEELPLPLRPMAYLKPSWKLSSEWNKWPLSP